MSSQTAVVYCFPPAIVRDELLMTLLHIKNARGEDFRVELRVPLFCNFITFENYNKARQVKNPCLFLL